MPIATQTEMLRDLVVRLFPLPQPEKRKSGFPPVKWLHPGFRLERDGDYLCYLLFKMLLFAGVGLLAGMVLDISLKTGLFIDASQFEKNKLILPARFSQITGPVSFFCSIVFYVRLRFSIRNIRTEHIPIIYRKVAFAGASRRKVFLSTVFLLVVALAAMWLNYIIIQRFILHFEQQDNTFFVLSTQCFAPLAIAAGAMGFVSLLLIFEKSARFFPEFMEDLMASGSYAPWDKLK